MIGFDWLMKVVPAKLLHFNTYSFFPLINKYIVARPSNFHLLVLAFMEDFHRNQLLPQWFSTTNFLIPSFFYIYWLALGRTRFYIR